MRGNYAGSPHVDDDTFDTDLVSHKVANLKRGKAPGLDGRTSAFLPPCLSVILAKLFRCIFLTS